MAILGRVLEHDDTDFDTTKVKKLDVGFPITTKQWEEMLGSEYWQARIIYRGGAPSPFSINVSPINIVRKKVFSTVEYQKRIHLSNVMVVEFLLESFGFGKLSVEHKGSLFVTFRSKQPDLLP